VGSQAPGGGALLRDGFKLVEDLVDSVEPVQETPSSHAGHAPRLQLDRPGVCGERRLELAQLFQRGSATLVRIRKARLDVDGPLEGVTGLLGTTQGRERAPEGPVRAGRHPAVELARPSVRVQGLVRSARHPQADSPLDEEVDRLGVAGFELEVR